MDESNPKKENAEGKRRFSQEQYDMLLRCSEKKDMTEWNEWRKEHPDEEILLEEAPLENAWLEGAHLEHADLRDAHLENAEIRGAHLEKALLWSANLQDADLLVANLQGAILRGANLQDAKLQGANLQGAMLFRANLQDAALWGAHLQDAALWGANLQDAELEGANLQGAKLIGANLQDAELVEANLEKACFWEAKLQGADFSRAIVDGGTLICEKCEVDRDTKFEAVAFGNMRIYPKTRQLLECNVRRMNWEEWYKEHRFWRWPVQLFWAMSDYGMSTVRVVGVFFLLAFLFAAVYMNWGYWRPPGIVSNLIVQPEVGEAVLHYFGRALIRPVYFSIVTMTTLGFGDMYANKGSIAGHVILCVQVILGYVLLGALITRFAVLFTAGGPAGKFAKQKKKVDSVSGDNGIRGQGSTE